MLIPAHALPTPTQKPQRAPRPSRRGGSEIHSGPGTIYSARRPAYPLILAGVNPRWVCVSRDRCRGTGASCPTAGMSGGDGSPGWRRGTRVSPGHGAGSGKLGELVANELREGGKAAGNGAWERHGETEVRINGLEGEEKKKYKERRDKKAKNLKKGGGERGGEREKKEQTKARCVRCTRGRSERSAAPRGTPPSHPELPGRSIGAGREPAGEEGGEGGGGGAGGGRVLKNKRERSGVGSGRWRAAAAASAPRLSSAPRWVPGEEWGVLGVVGSRERRGLGAWGYWVGWGGRSPARVSVVGLRGPAWGGP